MAFTFNLHSGSGNTNWRGYTLSGNQVAFQRYTTPSCPIDNQGAYGSSGTAKNRIVVSNMGFDCGGYTATTTVRFQIYNSIGDYLASSGTISLPNNGTTVDLPRINATIGPKTLSGGELHGFGIWTAGKLGFQKQVNTSYDVYRDSSAGYTDNLGGAWSTVDDADKTMIGAVTYYYLPSAPLNLTETVVSGDIQLSWNAPSSDGGSAITGYYIRYRVAGTSAWSYVDTRGLASPTARTYTFTTLSGTYEFQVAAWNAASVTLGDSDNSGADVSSKWSGLVDAQAGALGPAVLVSTGETTRAWTNSEIYVCTNISPITWTLVNGFKRFNGTAWEDLQGV